MGMLLVSVLTKGKACRLPSTLKTEELETQYLEYSHHAECRMKCRNISEQEIKYILKKGSINYSKSGVHDTPCPTYAVEGKTSDGQSLRIIVADCDTISKIVTAIDLNLEKDTCECK